MDVEDVLARMTLEEKASLTAGADFWSTTAVERLGIPALRMTDGPSGARGTGVDGARATCVPCGTALGASWDTALVERVGALVGAETRARGAHVLLAPTVNLHRSPLAGRNFESYSEDPLLAGTLAAAYVRGVQSQGVAATVKHFAGNESETERMTMDSVVDERTLRELYLVPFEMAVRDGGVLGVMTAYNRLNGVQCADHAWLLGRVLRGQWGFDGFVVTDWMAAASTADAARAGTDLEMPGPGRALGPALAAAVRTGLVDADTVERAARRMLRLVDRVGGGTDTGTGPAAGPGARDDRRVLAREAAAVGAVLLKNDGALLPVDLDTVRSVAVIGPLAATAEIVGGGSANLAAEVEISPLQAIRDRFGEQVRVVHAPGVDVPGPAPVLTEGELTAPDGRRGLLLEVFAGHAFAGDAVEHRLRSDTDLTFFDPSPVPELPEFSVRATGRFAPAADGPHTFSLAQLGRARLLVDGDVALDATAGDLPPGSSFLGFGSAEITATVELARGRPVEVTVEFANVGAPRLSGVRIGCRRPAPADLLDRAVAAAAAADVAVVVVGTGAAVESEGFDRTSLHLPGGQDELVERVLAANPRTVVVVNAGTVVAMPWEPRCRAVLNVWFGGQEMSPALADVLVGDADPGGRLPTSVPLRLEDTPAYGNFPATHGRVRYDEGVLLGYRWHETKGVPVRFPFGHGLSYTTFGIGTPRLSAATFRPGDTLVVEVPVTNTGDRAGSEVVQCYVAPPPGPVTRPDKELKAFAKLSLAAGESGVAQLTLGDRAFAYWETADGVTGGGGWTLHSGTYELHIGRSSADIRHVVPVELSGTKSLATVPA